MSAQCNIRNNAFAPGEQLKYNVAYNWGFIWVDAGSAGFEAKLTTYDNKPSWYFESYGTSYPSYDWFFKVREKFQAYVDSATFSPLWAYRDANEGGFIVLEKYIFDNKHEKVISTVSASNVSQSTDTIKNKYCLNDLLTAAYFARNLDFSNCKINDKIPFWVLVFGKVYPLYIRYLGKEEVILHDSTKYNCIKFSSKLVEGTIFKGGEDMFVWVTDDKNHIPIKVQANIIVGSVIAEINEFRGIKYPFSSKLN